MEEVCAFWLGLTRYEWCWHLQHRLHAAIAARQHPPTLLLLEHEPVITLGKHATPGNLNLPEQELAERGIALHRVERGGDVTFHGPGQLVGYPLLYLKELGLSVAAYLRRLEESLLLFLGDHAVSARREPGFTGVWHESGKLAAIGIAVKRWVTYHGFALNVTTDLSYFSLINPCGLSRPVTSLRAIGGTALPCRDAASQYLSAFAAAFEVEVSELKDEVPAVAPPPP